MGDTANSGIRDSMDKCLEMRESPKQKTFNIVNKEDAWKDNDRW